jgi:hypothetical protein
MVEIDGTGQPSGLCVSQSVARRGCEVARRVDDGRVRAAGNELAVAVAIAGVAVVFESNVESNEGTVL